MCQAAYSDVEMKLMVDEFWNRIRSGRLLKQFLLTFLGDGATYRRLTAFFANSKHIELLLPKDT